MIMSSAFDVKIRLMEDAIPSGKNCRTAIGRLGKCRELTEFRQTALPLRRHADTDAERQRVDDLIAEIDRRRTDLGRGGNFARQIAEDKARRAPQTRAQQIARIARLAQRLPAGHPFRGFIEAAVLKLQNSNPSAGVSQPDGDSHSNNSQAST